MYLYGFIHVSSTERLQGDSKGSPCWVQVVLHHLRTELITIIQAQNTHEQIYN